MDRFYNDLAPFDVFGEFAELGAYEPVPDDWHVVIADIRGSTKAIEAGRYKDVNMVGAAAITAVLNVCGDVEVPFVFGGDGGTVLVPASLRDAAADALMRLQGLSKSTFGLELRTGTVPVADVREKGCDIRIRKFRLSPGNYLAMFTGGGMEMADALLKGEPPDPRYVSPAPDDPPEPDLEGLSCRWEPLTPRGGTILTLMVRGVEPDANAESAVLQETVARLRDILGDSPRNAAPANEHSMRFRWPPRGLGLEARATAAGRSIAWRYMEIWVQSFLQWICERFDVKMGDYDAPVYREELRSNTDFRKYDDTLRMVLDVTPGQADAIEQHLEAEYAAGRLLYGTHRAGAALMTCLVFSIAQGEHVHFIDGADGGFARAATGFKKRSAALQATSTPANHS